MPSRSLLPGTLVVASLFICSSAFAQQPPEGQSAGTTATPATTETAPAPQPSSAEVRKEADQTLVNLGTTLPLRKWGSYFRITHRFSRDLRRGTFGQLAEDLFSLDNGAIIGLEYRIGLPGRTQAGINRSIFGKTISVFGRWDGWQQPDGHPLSLSTTLSIEGQNNLRVDQQPGISATLSRVWGPLALYASPTFIWDAHTPTLQALHEGHEHGGEAEEDPELDDDNLDQDNTAYIGLGVRAHIRPSVALVFEISPRIHGYTPDTALWSAGIEKLTRGHVLQLNFSNSFGTTPGHVARGGSPHDVYMGFNLTRKW
jgi:hypothetical protein